MKSHFLAAFTMLKNSKKCLVPSKNPHLGSLVPEISESSSFLKNNLATGVIKSHNNKEKQTA